MAGLCARLKTACSGSANRRHETPLPATALQFLLAHPLVSAIIPGALAPEQVEANVSMLEQPIPPALWAELKAEGLLPTDVPTP